MLATDCSSELNDHRQLQNDSWKGKFFNLSADDIINLRHTILNNIIKLGELTGEDTNSWSGYIKAHQARRAFSKTWEPLLRIIAILRLGRIVTRRSGKTFQCNFWR